MNKEYTEKYGYYKRMTETALEKITDGADEPLRTTMKYAVSGGGKRLRPVLFLSLLEGYGKKITDDDLMFAAAIELIHSYSLVHDDLPEMDNDAERRGKPSCHVQFGHALALLTGDALLNLAFEVMSSLACKDRVYAEAMRHVSVCTGHRGMIGGQTMEFSVDLEKAGSKTLALIENLKTGKLIEASAVSAAIISGNAKETILMVMFSAYFGCAFQIKDDLLEKETDEKNILARISRDEAEKELALNASRAYDFLAKASADTGFTAEFIKEILARDKG